MISSFSVNLNKLRPLGPTRFLHYALGAHFPDRLRWIVWKRCSGSLWGHPWEVSHCGLWRFLRERETIGGTSCCRSRCDTVEKLFTGSRPLGSGRTPVYVSSPTIYHSTALQRCTLVYVCSGSRGKVSLHHKVWAGARPPYDALNTMKFIYSVHLMDMREICKLQILPLSLEPQAWNAANSNELVWTVQPQLHFTLSRETIWKMGCAQSKWLIKTQQSNSCSAVFSCSINLCIYSRVTGTYGKYEIMRSVNSISVSIDPTVCMTVMSDCWLERQTAVLVSSSVVTFPQRSYSKLFWNLSYSISV